MNEDLSINKKSCGDIQNQNKVNQDDNQTISYQNLKIKNKIASGLTADIYLAELVNSSPRKTKDYAIKIFNKKTEKFYYTEVNFLKERIKHKNLITVYSWGKVNIINDLFYNCLYIIMEYIYYGDLVALLEKDEKITDKQIKSIINGIINGLEVMHSNGYVHRDIKPENILLIPSGDIYDIKITDFGFVEEINKISNEKKGTKGYMSPEVIKKKPTNAESIDIFALGVVLFILVTGDFHFDSPNDDDEFYTLIKNGEWTEYWKQVGHNEVSNDFKNVFENMVCESPQKRLTFKQLRNHVWFKSEKNGKGS